MITSFFFHHFKSLAQAELSAADLTILIGSNASGKTNIIEALRILSESAAGQSLAVIMDGSRNTAGVIRGGSAGCPQMPHTSFELGCTWEGASYKLVYRIEITVQKGVKLKKESLTQVYDKRTELLFTTAQNEDGDVFIDCLSDSGACSDRIIGGLNLNRSVLSQIDGLLPAGSEASSQIRQDTQTLVGALTKMFFFQPQTELMRDYVRLGEERMKPDGSNLSAVLYALCQTEEGRTSFKGDIISVIRNLPDNEIENIEFITTQLNDVILALTEKYNQYPMDAKRLSDGTLRSLALAALVYSEEPGSTIVMEEMDSGIHPSRIKRLLKMIYCIAKERQLQLIITTHNPVLMDAVDDGNSEGVVVCYRDREDGGSHFLRMVDFPDFYRLAAKGTAGHLAQNDEFVKSITRPTDNLQKFHDWLES
ncbi:MAG: ATP-binding protein [bacterium]|nr:ATP-binding protein [bacterium]